MNKSLPAFRMLKLMLNSSTNADVRSFRQP